MKNFQRPIAALALAGMLGATPASAAVETTAGHTRFTALAHDFFYWGFSAEPVAATCGRGHIADLRIIGVHADGRADYKRNSGAHLRWSDSTMRSSRTAIRSFRCFAHSS